MTNNTTITYRIGEVEKKVDRLDSKIDKLLTNHLPHLQEEITAIKTRVNVLFGLNVGAIIIGIIVSKII